MTRVPGGTRVDRALRTTLREVARSLKRLHHEAAKLTERGNYAGTQSYAQLATEIGSFETRLEELRSSWRALSGRGGSASGKKTPQWGYYRLILTSLTGCDVRLSTAQLVERLEPLVAKELGPNDFEMHSSGKLRWHVMVKRAKRHMTRDGFLDQDSGAFWKISAAGRRALADGASIKEATSTG